LKDKKVVMYSENAHFPFQEKNVTFNNKYTDDDDGNKLYNSKYM